MRAAFALLIAVALWKPSLCGFLEIVGGGNNGQAAGPLTAIAMPHDVFRLELPAIASVNSLLDSYTKTVTTFVDNEGELMQKMDVYPAVRMNGDQKVILVRPDMSEALLSRGIIQPVNEDAQFEWISKGILPLSKFKIDSKFLENPEKYTPDLLKELKTNDAQSRDVVILIRSELSFFVRSLQGQFLYALVPFLFNKNYLSGDCKDFKGSVATLCGMIPENVSEDVAEAVVYFSHPSLRHYQHLYPENTDLQFGMGIYQQLVMGPSWSEYKLVIKQRHQKSIGWILVQFTLSLNNFKKYLLPDEDGHDQDDFDLYDDADEPSLFEVADFWYEGFLPKKAKGAHQRKLSLQSPFFLLVPQLFESVWRLGPDTEAPEPENPGVLANPTNCQNFAAADLEHYLRRAPLGHVQLDCLRTGHPVIMIHLLPRMQQMKFLHQTMLQIVQSIYSQIPCSDPVILELLKALTLDELSLLPGYSCINSLPYSGINQLKDELFSFFSSDFFVFISDSVLRSLKPEAFRHFGRSHLEKLKGSQCFLLSVEQFKALDHEKLRFLNSDCVLSLSDEVWEIMDLAMIANLNEITWKRIGKKKFSKLQPDIFIEFPSFSVLGKLTSRGSQEHPCRAVPAGVVGQMTAQVRQTFLGECGPIVKEMNAGRGQYGEVHRLLIVIVNAILFIISI